MKKIILFIFYFISLFASAQPYTTIFGVDSTIWSYSFCNLDQAPVFQHIAYIDTTINGYTNKKVGTINGNSIEYSIGGTFSNGFVREDTASGKVWFNGLGIFGQGIREFLVIDLSLNLNDTFIVYNTAMVDSTFAVIDSIYWIGIKKYVRTNFSVQEGKKLTFIEGIGTNYGLHYMNDPYNLCPCLNSYKKDNTLFYTSACSSVGINENFVSANSINIYPHPILNKSRFEFENPNKERGRLVMMNALGQIIKTYVTTGNHFDIQNDNNWNGIFYYNLLINDQPIVSGRLLFQK